MNIKIKSAGVFCLIGNDYDKIYTALKKQFGESDEQLFTERIPGYEYLQWELPGDGWTALSAGDPLLSQEVKKELLHRQQSISQKFGNNQAMAQKILTVPDNNYIYFKYDNTGRLLIRLTAWGYRYPERIGGDMTGNLELKEKTEHVFISLIYDGKPLPGKSFHLNGLLRSTDANGELNVGDLPIGYQFDIKADDQERHVTVMPGQDKIEIDLTQYTDVEVQAFLDGNSYSGAEVRILYMNHSKQLTCDNNGRATIKLPLHESDCICTVTIDDETQQKALQTTGNIFVFQLMSPPKEEEDKGNTEGFSSDTDSKDKEKNTPSIATVEIKATLDDMPYAGAQVTLLYGNDSIQSVCDKNGCTIIQLPLNKEENTCRVTIKELSQQEVIKDGINRFEFHFKSVIPPVEEIKKTPWWIYLLEILAALALAFLVYLTYSFCRSILWG